MLFCCKCEFLHKNPNNFGFFFVQFLRILGGKRNEELILPVNDSVSGTLSTDELCATTTIIADPSYTEDKMWLNDEEVTIWDNARLKNCIEHCKYYSIK